MKLKRWATTLLAAGILISATSTIPENIAEAAFVWEGKEVVQGQIGKVTFTKATKVYRKNANGSISYISVDKGQSYRVYAITKEANTTVYKIGKDIFVKASNALTYKALPKNTLQAFGVKTSTITYHESDAAHITYTKIEKLNNTAIQKSINGKLYQSAENTYTTFRNRKAEDLVSLYEYYLTEGDTQEVATAKAEDYVKNYFVQATEKVVYNENNILSIETNYADFLGGAHGYQAIIVTHYNLLTGKPIVLSNYLKTPQIRKKANAYVKQQMLKENEKIEMLYFADDFQELDDNINFYIKPNGLLLVFNPYEYGPYVSGIRYILLPNSIFN